MEREPKGIDEAMIDRSVAISLDSSPALVLLSSCCFSRLIFQETVAFGMATKIVVL